LNVIDTEPCDPAMSSDVSSTCDTGNQSGEVLSPSKLDDAGG
jgi:hypothetical protein